MGVNFNESLLLRHRIPGVIGPISFKLDIISISWLSLICTKWPSRFFELQIRNNDQVVTLPVELKIDIFCIGFGSRTLSTKKWAMVPFLSIWHLLQKSYKPGRSDFLRVIFHWFFNRLNYFYFQAMIGTTH